MSIEQAWEKALRNTEIIRARVQALMTTGATYVPYILLSESSVNMGDTVVRQGEVVVEKPTLIVPPNNPQFKGFEFEELAFNENTMMNFLLVRGVSVPSFRYDNRTVSLEVYGGKLSTAIKHYESLLQQKENVKTGLIAGPEDVWPFSLLIFICSQIARNAETDIRKLLEEYHKKKKQ
ncbi:MAG TPA: hypothetical protein VI749_01310 [Candidatus Omnitrophota bacterium]|nr:hypothetical protein [Candidatus Omnitrophota bacterium]